MERCRYLYWLDLFDSIIILFLFFWKILELEVLDLIGCKFLYDSEFFEIYNCIKLDYLFLLFINIMLYIFVVVVLK